MQIKHLRQERCPFCNRPTKGIEITGTHCNGQQFETRTYECGLKLEWSPNYKCEQTMKPCPKDPEFIAANAAIEKECLKLKKAIEGLSSEKLKNTVKNALRYTPVYSHY